MHFFQRLNLLMPDLKKIRSHKKYGPLVPGAKESIAEALGRGERALAFL